MSETTGTAAAPAAAPAKPKRPKAKSLIMCGEQSAALLENARLAKERGEMVGWSTSIFPQEIAEALHISMWTARSHLQHILQKTGYKNRVELAVKARIAGVVIDE